MKITSRFTVAVHTLLVINAFQDKVKTTSEFIASSVNVNPVVIRRTMQSLKAAGMIDVKAGSGGARLARRPEDITLFDVYSAVDSVEGDLFHFHENPNPACPVGRNIHLKTSSKRPPLPIWRGRYGCDARCGGFWTEKQKRRLKAVFFNIVISSVLSQAKRQAEPPLPL